ncbi:MAG: leucine-rich repeat domain-containing protein [Eubacterium sp.]|nr:leucine-rich repeat domain-containing protein [Eubacterium sp.]
MKKLALFLAVAMAVSTVNIGTISGIKNVSAASSVKMRQKQSYNIMFDERFVNNDVNFQLVNGTLTVSGKGFVTNDYRSKIDVDKIKEIVMKPGITGIGNYVFKGLKNVRKITIPNTVTKLGYGCFAELKMDSLVIPTSVQEIGGQCMEGGTIKTVVMPGKYKNVDIPLSIYGTYTFLPKTERVYLNTDFSTKNMSVFHNVKKIYTLKRDKKYKVINNCIYTKNGKKLVFVPDTIEYLKVKKGCRIVSANAVNYRSNKYCCKNLKKIDFPASVKKIEYDSGLNYRKSPLIKAKVKFASKKLSGKTLALFAKCGKKEYLTNKYGVIKQNGMYISKDGVLIRYSGKSKNLVIPKRVKHIAPYAFKFVELGSVTLPTSMKKVDEYAFFWAKLDKVKLPESITSIEKYAFLGTTIKEIKIPKSVVKIKKGSFLNTVFLRKISFSKKLKYIGDEAFSYSGLKSLELPNTVKYIGECAFEGNNMSKVVLPDSVKHLGDGCFSDCKSLKKIKFPKNLKTIPKRLCQNGGLRELKLPSGIKKIEEYAFCCCNDLKTVRFNNQLEYIGSGAFSGTDVSKIFLPDSVKECGEGTFCETPLKTIRFSKNMTKIPNYMCSSTKMSKIVIPGNIRTVASGAFEGCPSKQVELEEGVQYIDETSFDVSDDHYSFDTKDKNPVYSDICIPKSLKGIYVKYDSCNLVDKTSVNYSTKKDLSDAKSGLFNESEHIIDLSKMDRKENIYLEWTRKTKGYEWSGSKWEIYKRNYESKCHLIFK